MCVCVCVCFIVIMFLLDYKKHKQEWVLTQQSLGSGLDSKKLTCFVGADLKEQNNGINFAMAFQPEL